MIVPLALVRGRLRHFWSGSGGGREVLAVAYPLILSQMSFTLETFGDRLFLTWFSPEAMAGAVAGMFATWGIIGLFVGTAEFLTTFVAQYFGARRPGRIGAVVWQGLYFSALAGVLTAALAPLVGPVFAWVDHAPEVQRSEVVYTSILLVGAFPTIAMAALSTFFSGRGHTRVVLLVNVIAAVLDLFLNYVWIFGKAGFPRAGVAGAAWSTVLSQGFGALLFFVLVMRREFRSTYGTLAGWRFESPLFLRLLRYGLPTGAQFAMEVSAFAAFLMIVGRIGTLPLAASSIAFNLNGLVFMPMWGLGIGVSSLVGRYLGAERPEIAERSTWSAFWISLVYMFACGALYVGVPRILLAAYAVGSDAASFAGVEDMAVVLLRFVALYSIFDMMNVIFAAGLKGAGDTAYPVKAVIVLSWGAMLVPGFVLCVLLGAGVYVAWCTATAYVVCVGLLMFRRFHAGGWKSLRVIEPQAPGIDLRASAEQQPA